MNKENKGRYVMKFLLVVLIIHFTVELIMNRKRENKVSNVEVMDDTIRHPAEYELR